LLSFVVSRISSSRLIREMNINLAKAVLKQTFGFNKFRPLQQEVIESIYGGRDVVVLMPTGGGKSLCYQIPAITMPGVSLVVSPLISLMKDQVDTLGAHGVPAAYLNSSLDSSSELLVEEGLLAGYIKLLYLSPERLVSSRFLPLLKRLPVNLLAVDEAHCISTWGHDFRPEYTRLRFFKSQFPEIPIIALTATADRLTRRDIIEQLGLNEPAQYLASFDRPNIRITVRQGHRRLEQMATFLEARRGQSGIIYCLSRRNCEELSKKLNDRGIRASYYHADLSVSQRVKVQDDFLNDRVPVIVATLAFGMGIDKSNVRFVIHYNLPRNVEAYYQEIGRAGRDGLDSEALLFFSFADVQAYRDMFAQSGIRADMLALKLAKLDRMFQVAESTVCRRRTILSYFSETYDRPCGNCDICLSPPRYFDATLAVQKALSAVVRTGERIGVHLLIDILRGSLRREIRELGYDSIQTFGVGREYSFFSWQSLIYQMVQSGFLEIAYEDHHTLKVTELGRGILLGGKQVNLSIPLEDNSRRGSGKNATVPVRVVSRGISEVLFEELIALRRQLAQRQGVPPYIIFNDATLKEMSERRPVVDSELLEIGGVGERKLHLYGDAFLSVIRGHERSGDSRLSEREGHH
jgi:ATP-dependent DNA helicase RecQ